MNKQPSKQIPRKKLVKAIPKPGADLRNARENQGLAIKQIATELNMLEEMVVAIEEDTIASKINLTYARGYTINYAKLLHLNPDRIARQFDINFGSTTQTLKRQQAKQNVQRQHTNLAWSVYTAIVAIIFITAWFIIPAETTEEIPLNDAIIKQGIDIDPMLENNEPISTEPDINNQSSIVENNSNVNQSAPVLMTENNQSDTTTESTNQNSIDEDITTAVNLEDIRPTSIALNTDSIDTNPDSSLPANDNENNNNTVQLENTNALKQAEDSLLLEITNATWIAITDANDELLFRDLRSTLGPLEVKGKAPFKVILGNAPGNRLTLNGKNIDITRFIRANNYANFQVDNP